MLAGEPVQRGDVDAPTGCGDDERLDVLLGQLGRNADDRGLGDVGMTLQRGLDLGRREVLTPAADDLLLAPDEGVGAFAVFDDEIGRASCRERVLPTV